MQRRIFLKSVAAAPVAIAASGASVFSQASNICVVMEERDGSFVLEGKGQTLTEPFELEFGRYRIEVDLSSDVERDDYIHVSFYERSSGDLVDYFSEMDLGNELPEFISSSIELDGDGEYLAEIDSYSGDWKIVLSPI